MKTQTEDRAALMALGLNPDAPALDHIPARQPAQPATVALAPEGVDPHAMPVSDIVFDPALLDDFPDLTGQGRAAATRYVFDLYKSRGRNKDRNRRLQDEIGLFILRVRRSREPGAGRVKDKIRSTQKDKDLLVYLASHGITSIEDLTTKLGG